MPDFSPIRPLVGDNVLSETAHMKVVLVNINCGRHETFYTLAEQQHLMSITKNNISLYPLEG